MAVSGDELNKVDCDDVPPLEDMSHVISKMAINSTTTTKASDNDTQYSQVLSPACQYLASKQQSICQKKETSFGGMKKGFLFGISKEKTSTGRKQTDSVACDKDIPFIKSNQNDKNEQFKIPEVQEAMSTSKIFSDNHEWVTDDLLGNISKNEKLLKNLQNPQFMQAVSELQTNPKAAIAKYSGNPEMESFLKEFCDLLGNHFTKLAEASPAQSENVKTTASSAADLKVHNPHPAQDDLEVKEVLSNPEIIQILMDTDVKNFIQLLRKNPDDANSYLQNADISLKVKIRKLVDCGILQFHTN